MTDDIVTRLEHDLFQAARGAKTEQKRLLLERALNVVRVAEQRKKREEIMADEIERLRAERVRWERIAHDLYRRVDVYGEVCCCSDYDKHWCGLHAYNDEIMGLKERGKAFWAPKGTPLPVMATHEDDLDDSPEEPF